MDTEIRHMPAAALAACKQARREWAALLGLAEVADAELDDGLIPNGWAQLFAIEEPGKEFYRCTGKAIGEV